MAANVAKSKTMTFHPGDIISGISEEALRRHSTGKGETYRERLRRKMPCPDCGVEMTAGFMTDHLQKVHIKSPEIYWYRLLARQHENLPHVYEVRFPNTTNKCQCPLPR